MVFLWKEPHSISAFRDYINVYIQFILCFFKRILCIYSFLAPFPSPHSFACRLFCIATSLSPSHSPCFSSLCAYLLVVILCMYMEECMALFLLAVAERVSSNNKTRIMRAGTAEHVALCSATDLCPDLWVDEKSVRAV